MRTKGDRNGFVQMLMNRHPTAGQRSAQLTTLKLPDPVGEAHRVVARYYPLVLQREDQVEIFAAQRHKGGSFLTGRHGEALIELSQVVLTQKVVGLLQGRDAAQSQLLRQPALPSAKPALAATARLR